MLVFGLWRSCSVKDDWQSNGLSYDDYKASEDSMMLVIVIGFVLVAPSVWRSVANKASGMAYEVSEAQEFERKIRQNPNRCPKCSSEEFDTHMPSKPRLWTPVSFSGILLGAAANSMSNAMFKPERVCRRCGCRWHIPN